MFVKVIFPFLCDVCECVCFKQEVVGTLVRKPDKKQAIKRLGLGDNNNLKNDGIERLQVASLLLHTHNRPTRDETPHNASDAIFFLQEVHLYFKLPSSF